MIIPVTSITVIFLIIIIVGNPYKTNNDGYKTCTKTSDDRMGNMIIYYKPRK